MEQIKQAGSKLPGRVWGWAKRHKILTALLLAVCIGAAVLFMLGRRGMPGRTQGSAGYSFIRTVTLSKTSLDETVSSTGTVQSSNTSTVSYKSTGTGTSVTVKTVHVAVGDEVSAGDVIVTLDTGDLQTRIQEQETALAERRTEALESYEAAQVTYDDAVSASEAAEPAVTSAKNALADAQAALEKASASLSSFQAAYDTAAARQNEAGRTLNDAQALYNSCSSEKNAAQKIYDDALTAQANAQAAYDTAQAAAAAAPDNADLAAAANTAQQALTAAQAAQIDAGNALSAAEQSLAGAESTLNDRKGEYTAAESDTANALTELNKAKQQCGYDSYHSTYNQAQSTYASARSQLDQLESKVTSAEDALERARETWEESGESDTLEDLYDQLENAQLKAETSGKITALNVGVGDTPNGVVATIQDTNALKINITIPESSINEVSVGMSCRIQSDATEDVIAGTLTQIDPVSSQGGSFGAEVTVTTVDTGLRIGMNASVEILLSSVKDCFSVPKDAVATDERGSYLYRKTGGEGADMTFEKVYVTTGDSNDYYIEVSGNDLVEGDVIRASADLTQGLETVENEGDTSSFLMGNLGGIGGFGGGSGGNMPGGGNRPDMVGGMPSGGMPGNMSGGR